MKEVDGFLYGVTFGAKLIGRCESAVRLYADDGRLPCLVLPSGQRLFRLSDLQRLAAEIAVRDGRIGGAS